MERQETRPKRTVLIYISGKISGLKDLNKPKFEQAERRILMHHEHEDMFVYVLNPHELPADHDKRWGSYMSVCLQALISSNKIYMLDDWKSSKGALTELLMAKMFNKPSYSVDTMRRMHVSYSYLFFKLFLKFLNHNDAD